MDNVSYLVSVVGQGYGEFSYLLPLPTCWGGEGGVALL